MRVIIAGSRSFINYTHLKNKMDKILEKTFTPIEIVSGACKGADLLGERYAKECGYPVKQFPANWSKGKSAGLERNVVMADYADALVAFWDGSSKGTKHMIDIARSKGLQIRIIQY